MNNLVSDLATVAAQEKAMLDECEELLASAAAMQVRVIQGQILYQQNSGKILGNHFPQINVAIFS